MLVIMVEPPRQGDPIYTLKKTHGSTEAGTIFVRHPGTTDRAGPSDVEMLTARAVQAAPQLEIVVSSPSTLYAVDGSPEAMAAWIDDERDHLLQPLRDEEKRRASEPPQAPVLGLDPAKFVAAHSLMGMLGTTVPEARSAQDFNAEVEEYLDLARNLVVPVAMVSFFDSEFGQFTVKVTNTTDRNFANVRLELTFGPEVRLDTEELERAMPKRPRPWGPRQEGGVDLDALDAFSTGPAGACSFSHLALERPPLQIDHTISGRTISYWVNHLRPRDDYESEPLTVLLDPSIGETVSAHWAATSTQIDGVAGGDLSVPVSERRAPLDALVPHTTKK